MLLQLTDLLAAEVDPVSVGALAESVTTIASELTTFDDRPVRLERCLVLNKGGLVSSTQAAGQCAELVRCLHWREPVFMISVLTAKRTAALAAAAMQRLEQRQTNS